MSNPATQPPLQRTARAPAPGAVVVSEADADTFPIRKRHVVGVSVTACLLMIVGLGFALRWLSLQPPDWWRSVDPTKPATIDAANRLQNALITEAHRVDRPIDEEADIVQQGGYQTQPWRIALNAELANAWLSVELPKWLDSEAHVTLPTDVSEIQAEFRGGVIMLGVSRASGRNKKFYWLTLRPELDENGSLWMRAERTVAGQLPVPRSMVIDAAFRAAEANGENLNSPAASAELDLDTDIDSPITVIASILAGKRPMLHNAVVRLEDGRMIRLQNIRANNGKLEITCITERASNRVASEEINIDTP
ncbi:MAG: hypothetical protein H6815_04295 [Phycisphaeraceae bacterium]|nr:hypothetical protein [Phycisphaerales bacterium]MCB9859652.1 hypothetical protein [Phycisphaeraceae bacterium]